MAIVSTTEIKNYLGIASSDTSLDAQIGLYLQPAIWDFLDYTNNWFDVNSVMLTTPSISATSSDYVLRIIGTNFSTWGFQAGDELRIRNSRRNDGFFTIQSMTSTSITLWQSSDYVATNQIKPEYTYEATWIINSMMWPPSVKPLLAAMIKFKIENPFGIPQSESLGDYSVTYGTRGGDGSGYPDGITRSLNKYRLVQFA